MIRIRSKSRLSMVLWCQNCRGYRKDMIADQDLGCSKDLIWSGCRVQLGFDFWSCIWFTDRSWSLIRLLDTIRMWSVVRLWGTLRFWMMVRLGKGYSKDLIPDQALGYSWELIIDQTLGHRRNFSTVRVGTLTGWGTGLEGHKGSDHCCLAE